MEENKIKNLLKNYKGYLDAEDISKKIGGNVFAIDDVLRKFEKKGLVISR